MGALGEALRASVHARLKARGNDVVHRGGLVLHLEVVELGTRHNLYDRERVGILVAEHRDGDLRSGHAALNEHTPTRGPRVRDGRVDLGPLRDPRDTKARAVRSGLHKHRKADALHEAIELVVAQLHAARKVNAFRNGNSGGLEDRLGHLLLGGGGRGSDAGEGVGDVQYLEESLDAAVLSVHAVKSHEGHVVASAHELGNKVPRSKIKQVNRGKAGIDKRPAALLGRLHGNLPLVRPASPDDHDALAHQLFSVHRCPFATAHMR